MGAGLLIMRQKSKSWMDRCTLMEQSFAHRGDIEKLIDAKLWGVHSTDSWLQPANFILLDHEWIIAHSWHKVYQTEWWRGADRHQIWGFAFDRQPTTALPSIPLVNDVGTGLLIMWQNSKSWTDRCTLKKQNLAERGDGDELIWHQSWRCVFSGQPTTSLPSILLVYDMGPGLLINFQSWTDHCTLMEQCLADRVDGEEMVDTKPRGVHLTDSRLQSSPVRL